MKKPEKKLGFGLMRLPLLDPDKADSINIEELKKMVDSFMEQGFTYFDTAWMYCAFQSECAIKEALVDRYPRESYTLADKLHAAFFNSKEERDEIFEKQLEKTGVSYFDYYLIHDIEAEFYPKFTEHDCFNWLIDKKEKGLVKHIGFSFHDTPELLDRILTEHPEFEFVQLQINYLDWENPGIQSRKCYEVAQKHNKPVVIMEPVKGGTLANVPDPVTELFKGYDETLSVPSWAIRFAASLDNVMVVLSGMSNMEQLLDNTSYMKEFKPLTEEEVDLCMKATEVLYANIAVPCTGCSYCTEGCPREIPIPRWFRLYNEEKQKKDDSTGPADQYARLSQNMGKASDCIGCGQCEGVCPQHLEIINLLQDVAEVFE